MALGTKAGAEVLSADSDCGGAPNSLWLGSIPGGIEVNRVWNQPLLGTLLAITPTDAGCGEGPDPSSSQATAQVKGTITRAGQRSRSSPATTS
jgi:hypothetical protein